MLKVNDKDTRMTSSNDVVLVSLMSTLNIFHTFFKCFDMVNSEHVIASWAMKNSYHAHDCSFFLITEKTETCLFNFKVACVIKIPI